MGIQPNISNRCTETTREKTDRHSWRGKKIIFFLLLSALLFTSFELYAASPQSDTKEKDRIVVFQRKPFLRKYRFEIEPLVSFSLNENLIQHYFFGVNLKFHILEDLAIGFHFSYAVYQYTGMYDKVIEDYLHWPSIDPIKFVTIGEINYSFLYGKFNLFDAAIVHYDAYVIFGLGDTRTFDGDNFTIAFGLGGRFYVTRWLAISYQFVDNVYNTKDFMHNFNFTLGASFFFPTGFKYKTLK